MEGVEEVRQEGDKCLHWKADVKGKHEAWDATITEQVPDRNIAWHSTSGAPNAGEVRFEPLSDSKTRVSLWLEIDLQSLTEKVGGAIGVLDRQVETDLERFKHFIEGRGGEETGGWRGEIGRGKSS